MGKHISKLCTTAFFAALCGTASAYTLTGTVSDNHGQAIKDVDVSLLKEGKTTKTDDKGEFTIHEDEDSITTAIHPAFKNAVGYININNGILSYSQSSTSPVQVKIYNSLGNHAGCRHIRLEQRHQRTRHIFCAGFRRQR